MAVDGATTPLIGRVAETARIRDLVGSASAGEGQLLLLDGDAGIGKTRLVDEALAVAAGLGMRTLRAQAEELDSRRPFALMTDALGVTTRSTDPRRRDAARMLYEGSASETRMVEALVVLVEDLCGTGPVALALDDLHWADVPTLKVIHRLAGIVQQYPLLLVGAYRPVPAAPELAALIRDAEERQATVLHVLPLSSRDVGELLSSVLGVRPGPRLTRQAAVAGGNPFYVTELVAALRASGSLDVSSAGAEIGTVALPPALMLTVLLELSFLSKEAQDVLRAAAVLGSSFTLDDLGLVMERSAAELAPPIREALEARVLDDGGDRLCFRHNLLREAIYEDLPLSLRQGMHLHVADALAAHGASPLQVAEHFVRGASRGNARALEWLLRAADDATVASPATAADLLAGAAAMFEPTEPGRDALLADRVVCLESAARHEEAEQACVELLGRRQPPATEAKLRLCLARHLMRRGADDEALQQAALAEETEGLTPGQQARALGVASTLPLFSARLGQAEDIARRGMALAAEHGEAVAAAACALALGSVSYYGGRFAEALEWAAKATVDTDPTPANRMGQGWRHLIHGTQLLRAQVWLRLDLHEQAGDILGQCRREAEEEGHRVVLVFAQSVTVAHCFATGEWDNAVAEYDALVQLCAEFDDHPPLLQVGAGARALVAVHRGEPDARAALALTADIEIPHLSPLPSLARALLLEAAGSPDAALRSLAAAWDACIGAGVTAHCPLVGPDLVRLAVAAGDLARAGAVCDQVEAVAGANPPAASLEGSALRCRGLVAGDPVLLVRAASVLAEGPRPLEHGMACEDAAAALAGAGDLDGARRWLDEAIRVYDRLDAGWDSSRATARLRSSGVRRGSRAARARPKVGWEALTPGERAVVELVAAGLSNPDVAERLFLSRNTVKTHLANGMRKLGLKSRFELARGQFRRPQ